MTARDTSTARPDHVFANRRYNTGRYHTPSTATAARTTTWPSTPTTHRSTTPTTRTAGKAPMSDKPSVLFVCIHNAGRSQMAAGWLRHLGGDAVEVRSAGSAPADQINPVAVEAMREVGIDIKANKPKILDYATAEASDVIITMGCGDVCPAFPGKRYEDWKLEDPAGQGLRTVRLIRDEIRTRVENLLADLTPAG
ncbi:hypothetical protein Vlu01_51390 [Micromonospora lutea]|uniref:Phosphotyrosine protein phosphatase I domain-containing protein n=2 Tax=Micromonospora lutea TaxID=419825 RepID=A0ABQ4J3D8_9ACTN|nr:hypothetical protein Vlu01_51390 [Micromonospora lutea]